MYRLLPLIALAGCGRFGFEAGTRDGTTGTGDGDGAAADDAALVDMRPDVVPLGHDEDADGIRDIDDNCPHIAGVQTNADGDALGDLCDPNPGTPGDVYELFVTFTSGDQPFTLGPDDGVWTQTADGLRFDGTLGADQNLFGHLELPVTVGSSVLMVGLDILAIVPGAASNQNQIAVALTGNAPLYFAELNQQPGVYDVATLTYFDGTNYMQTDSQNLANGIHTGRVDFRLDQRVDVGVTLDVGWPGETYQSEVMNTVYQGATLLQINANNLHFEIRYVAVISSP